MSARSWLRLLGAAVVLAVLLWRFGTGPFVEAWRVTTWWAVLAALALTALGTLTSAWRWRVVAARLGVPVAPGPAIAAYYRSQFLNATLPGGILGDADRAVRHGREAGDLPAGLRATMWERLGGQVVQVALTVVALLLLPSPLRPFCPPAVGLGLLVGVAMWWLRRGGTTAARGFVSDDLTALLERPTAPRLVLASCGSTAAHLAVFLVAVRAVGVEAPLTVLVPTALVVLVVSSVPVNIAGWGPREGVTAWVFGYVGLGPAAGLTVSVVYGVLAAVATLPGAVVLLAEAVRQRDRRPAADPGDTMPVPAGLEEARHG
jgi:glycosyltransferase 2 family protein